MRRFLAVAALLLAVAGLSPEAQAQIHIFQDQPSQYPPRPNPTAVERGYNFLMDQSSSLAGGSPREKVFGKLPARRPVPQPQPGETKYAGPGVLVPPPGAPAYAEPVIQYTGPQIQYGSSPTGAVSVNALPAASVPTEESFAEPYQPAPQIEPMADPSPNRNYDETRQAMRRELTDYEKKIIYNQRPVY